MSAQGPQIATVALSHSPQMAQDTGHLQGRRFRAGFAQVAKAVADYQPTLAVYFGPDHMRALAGIAPCFTVAEAATGYGDWGTPQEDYRVPHERAIALGEHLAASGIDIALAPHLRLDHGFGQSTSDLFGSLSAVPLIPIVINCVDRRSPQRLAAQRSARPSAGFSVARSPATNECSSSAPAASPTPRHPWSPEPRPDRRTAAAADYRQPRPRCRSHQSGLGRAVPRHARQHRLDPAGQLQS